MSDYRSPEERKQFRAGVVYAFKTLVAKGVTLPESVKAWLTQKGVEPHEYELKAQLEAKAPWIKENAPVIPGPEMPHPTQYAPQGDVEWTLPGEDYLKLKREALWGESG